MLTIEMLPANEGDALWIEYGDPAAPARVLVDCGYKSTYRKIMERLDADPELRFELFILTHIDGDHIAGAVPFAWDARVTPARVGEVWFNGRKHLDDTLGVRQAEFFSNTLENKGFGWNTRFGEGAVFVPDDGSLPVRELDGGMRLTLLSPGRDQLTVLADEWSDELDEVLDGKSLETFLEEVPSDLAPDVLGAPDVEALAAGPFEPDDEPPNGSSIAVLAEYQDPFDEDRQRALLLTGDAFAPVVAHSLERLLAERGAERLRLDALKLSHHGSKGNTSSDLLELVDCRRFLVSTNGTRHKHPDAESIARVLVVQPGTKELYFNYRTRFNDMWAAPYLESSHDYTAHYPPANKAGLAVEITGE